MVTFLWVDLGNSKEAPRAKRLLCTIFATVPVGLFCATFALMMGFGGVKDKCAALPKGDTRKDTRDSLGKWYDALGDSILLPFVCEKPGNSCSSGWKHYGDSCYLLVCEWKSFDMASEKCKTVGGHLVQITSEAENKFVQEEMIGYLTAWIGLSEPPNSEEYQWEDGMLVGSKDKWIKYTNWHHGEPNNYGGKDEDAVFMNFWGHLGKGDPRAYDDTRFFLSISMVIWALVCVSLPVGIFACVACCAQQQSRSGMQCFCACGVVTIVFVAIDILVHIPLALAGDNPFSERAWTILVCAGCLLAACGFGVLCAWASCQSWQLASEYKAIAVQSEVPAWQTTGEHPPKLLGQAVEVKTETVQ